MLGCGTYPAYGARFLGSEGKEPPAPGPALGAVFWTTGAVYPGAVCCGVVEPGITEMDWFLLLSTGMEEPPGAVMTGTLTATAICAGAKLPAARGAPAFTTASVPAGPAATRSPATGSATQAPPCHR